MSGSSRLEDPSKEPWPRWRRQSVSRVVNVTRLEDDGKIQTFYDMGSVVGKGAFGVVYFATHKTRQDDWAIKVVIKAEAGTSGVKMMENELEILKRVDHPHIITLKEVFETPRKTMMVLEYCDLGDLETELHKQKRFDVADTKTVIGRLTSAVAYMHDNGMVHRDLKLQNILLQGKPGDRLNIKVTDFGLSCLVGSGFSQDSTMEGYCGTPMYMGKNMVTMETYCGTLMYMAPEVLCSIRNYTKQCDVWSMGVIMFFLLSGTAPFKAGSRSDLKVEIEKGKVNLSGTVWASVESGARSMLQMMLEKSPAKRISAKEVENHPWITGRKGEYTGNVLEMMREMRESLTVSSAPEVRVTVPEEKEIPEDPPMEEEKAKEEDAKAVKANQHPLRTSKSKSVSAISSPNGSSRPPSARKSVAHAATSVPSYMMPTRASAHSASQTKQRLAQGTKTSTTSSPRKG